MDDSPRGTDQVQALLKLWTDSFVKFSQAAFAFSPEATPPESLKQIRSALLQSMTQAWDEYLRSPQFLQSSRQLLDNAVAIRKLSQEYFENARQSMGAVGQPDLDGIVNIVRQLETRVLARLTDISQQLALVQEQLRKLDLERRKEMPPARRPRRKQPPQN